MSNFTPYSALAGGVLIGLAAALLLLCNGRIAGISGILAGLLTPKPGEVGWRLSFLAGLMAGPWLLRLLTGPVTIQIDASPVLLAVAGGLVGFGTRLGSGCTSGHGVCGLARGSLRSIVATLTFMLTAAATVFIMRHVFGWR